MQGLRQFVRRHQLAAGITAGVVIGGTLAGTGAAIAAIPSTTTKAFNACVNRTNGAVRIIDYQAGKRCFTRTERSVSWSVRGPAGPKGATGAAGPAGAPGATGPAGTPATKLWAMVDFSGALLASSGGVSVSRQSTGNYFVTFSSDVSHCAAVASPGQTPIYSSTGAGTGRAVGFLLVDQLSPGDTDPGGGSTANTVQIESLTTAGASVDNGFRVAVFC